VAFLSQLLEVKALHQEEMDVRVVVENLPFVLKVLI